MHILVTGGAGFIGSNFLHYTVTHHPDVEITVVDSYTYAANPAFIPDLPQVHSVREDICSPAMLDLVKGKDAVINFAAESHNDNSIRDPFAFIRTNVEGTMNLVQACLESGVRLHHVSTDEVYGDMPVDSKELFDLDSPYNPSSPYSASKAAGDHFVRAAIRTYGLKATISNCTNNYGPRQHPEKFIPRQIIRLLNDEPVVIYGDGRNIRDWIHVNDHCSAIWAIIHKGVIGNTYLVSARCERSNLEVADTLVRSFGYKELADKARFITDRPGHDRRYALDPSSMEALGWKPEADFESALAETIDWYRAHPHLWMEAFLESEQRYAGQN